VGDRSLGGKMGCFGITTGDSIAVNQTECLTLVVYEDMGHDPEKSVELGIKF
jgi:hypothetical protein